MNDLLALIARYGATVELRSGDDWFGRCTEHAEVSQPIAVAEVTATDCPEARPCAECLPRVIETALETAREAGDRHPRVTVTVARPAVAVPDVATARAA